MNETRFAFSRRDFVRAALAASLLVPGGVGGLVGQALAQGKGRPGVNRMRGDVRMLPTRLVLAHRVSRGASQIANSAHSGR